MRKGLGAGQGKGYRNIIGKDPHVHRQSACGIKQPQHLPTMPVSKRVPEGWVFVDWKDASGKLWKDNIPRDAYLDFKARVTLNGGAIVKTQESTEDAALRMEHNVTDRSHKPENLVDFGTQNQVSWAFSMLSDAQELIDMGRYKEANEKINASKRVLQGKYEVLDDGFSIRIFSREEIRAKKDNMEHHDRRRIVLVDVTKQVGRALEKAGYGSDSNNETDIKKAGMWDVLDALSGKDNSKFTKDEARKEAERRGL